MFVLTTVLLLVLNPQAVHGTTSDTCAILDNVELTFSGTDYFVRASLYLLAIVWRNDDDDGQLLLPTAGCWCLADVPLLEEYFPTIIAASAAVGLEQTTAALQALVGQTDDDERG